MAPLAQTTLAFKTALLNLLLIPERAETSPVMLVLHMSGIQIIREHGQIGLLLFQVSLRGRF